MRKRAAKEPVIVGSFNLHGVQDNDPGRYEEIAEELASQRIDICGLQEVVKGNGIEDTSFQIARHLYRLTGDYYWTYWAFCHPFFDKYPEGLSILAKYPFENPTIIKLDVSLKSGAKPLLPRVALSVECVIKARRIRFITLHLDHHPDPELRTAQASVLLKALSGQRQTLFGGTFITGDFNAREDSSCLRFFKRRGFSDTYRTIHREGGTTFPACNPMERIDYILKKGRLRVTDSYTFLKGNNLSDHFGVVTILT